MVKTLNYRFSWTFAISSALTSQKTRQRPTVLDWAVFDGKTIVLQSQSANSEAGIKTTLKLIKALPDFKVAESVCCMEHTGIYNAHILSYLRKISLPIWLENSRVGGPIADQKVRRFATAPADRRQKRCH